MGAVGGGILSGIEIRPPQPVVPGSLGLLGGTFDPVHHGHLAVAEAVREELGLEQVWFVPAANPPHRPAAPGADAAQRARMVELAIADNPAFALSRLELERAGPSYTADTLTTVVEGRRNAGLTEEPVLILSGEALRGLPTWHDPDRVLRLARLAVVPRERFATPDGDWLTRRFPGLEHRVTFLPGPLLPVSGSEIRARLAAGRSIRYLVPDAVARHIADHRLYRVPAPESRRTRPEDDPSPAANRRRPPRTDRP